MPTPLPSRALCCIAATLLSAMLTPAASAAEQRFRLDPVHTRIMFAIEHAGFSQALGAVSGSSGELYFDPDDWSSARVKVSVPLQRLDLGDPDWNRSVLAGNLLDAQHFPEATFVSTRIEPLDARHAAVHGLLTLRGISREVRLDATFNALKRHPLPPFRRTVGFSASTTISRADFGIAAWKSVIGDQVELRMEVEAIRERGNGDDADTDEPLSPQTTEPTP